MQPSVSQPPPRVARKQAEQAARGLLSENYHGPSGAATGATAATQTIFGGLLGLLAGDVVTNVGVSVSTVASGTPPTTIKLGLVDTTGAVLAVTANVAADSQWTASTGMKLFALTAPYTVPTDGGYYAVILSDGVFGTTPLQLARCNPTGGVEKAVSGGARPFIGVTGGQTNITGNLTLANVTAQGFWYGVS